jgi:hypothetical protein
MSNCCEVPASQVATTCPLSGTKGKPVELQTVKALLTERALRRVSLTSHRFCPDPDCEVVYFDDAGGRYTTEDVRVPVWQKEPFGARTICYCFGETEADMRAEIERLGRSDAVGRIRRHIEAGRCACEVRNPRGACCLGDVLAAVKRVALSLQDGEPGSEPSSGRSSKVAAGPACPAWVQTSE